MVSSLVPEISSDSQVTAGDIIQARSVHLRMLRCPSWQSGNVMGAGSYMSMLCNPLCIRNVAAPERSLARTGEVHVDQSVPLDSYR